MPDESKWLHLSARARKYLPTFSDLVDRLTIVQLKEIFLPEHSHEYQEERKLIEHDIDMILTEAHHTKNYRLTAAAVHAIVMVMLTNRFIWENESKARAGGGEQDKLLKLTHSINGVRNAAKNKLAADLGERRDYKLDCLAAELVREFGNWNVFQGTADPVSSGCAAQPGEPSRDDACPVGSHG